MIDVSWLHGRSGSKSLENGRDTRTFRNGLLRIVCSPDYTLIAFLLKILTEHLLHHYYLFKN